MDETIRMRRIARAVRDACRERAGDAFNDAAIRGLCFEGAVEVALDAIRSLDLDAVIARATDDSSI